MKQEAVKNRGIFWKIRELFLSSKYKKNEKETNNSFIKNNSDIIIIYIIGFCVLIFLTFDSSIIFGIKCVIAFGSLFIYDFINPYGKGSLWEYFGYPKRMYVLSLIGVLFLFSITSVLVKIKSLLNM